jgi:hypothetical protein
MLPATALAAVIIAGLQDTLITAAAAPFTAALQDTVTTATYPAAAGGSYTVTIELPPANASSSCHVFLLPGSLQLGVLQDEGHLAAAAEATAEEEQPAATRDASSAAAGEAVVGGRRQAASVQGSNTATHADANDVAADSAASFAAAASAAASAAAQPLQQPAVVEKGLDRAEGASTKSRHQQDALQTAAAEHELGSSTGSAAAGLAGTDVAANPAVAAVGLDSGTAGAASGRSLQQFQYNLGVETGPVAVQAEDRFIWGNSQSFVMPDNPVVAPRPGLDPAVQVASIEDYPVPIITLPNAGVVTLAAPNPLQLDGSQSLAATDDSIVSWAWAVRMISPQKVD